MDTRLYPSSTQFIIGFHSCDHSVMEKVLLGNEKLKSSENDYDWLGHGVYFWENNLSRALEYGRELKKHPSRTKNQIKEPAVIGAIIDLGNCLNLVESKYNMFLKAGYQRLEHEYELAGKPKPENRKSGKGHDLLLRDLDCAVIETVHRIFKEYPEYAQFDSVRGAFWEGKEVYPGAGFKEKNHIQICIRNPNCIKGYFKPLEPSEW